MKSAFISGPLKITKEEFDVYYKPSINRAIEANHHFIVGDAPGLDILAQEYLINKTSNVLVCHMFDKPRNLAEGIKYTKGGFKSDKERDSYMTKHTDYDIAWIKRNNSGTHKNIKRREAKHGNKSL